MLSGWILVASFILVPNLCVDAHPCIDASRNTGCVGTEADATKLLMAITIIPALIAIIVTIQPLILIRKTSFKKNTKLALAINIPSFQNVQALRRQKDLGTKRGACSALDIVAYFQQ